jgi:hypothetical protein
MQSRKEHIWKIYVYNYTVLLQFVIKKTQISVLTIPALYTVGHHAVGQLSVEATFGPLAANYRHTITIKLLPFVRGEDTWLPDDETCCSSH